VEWSHRVRPCEPSSPILDEIRLVRPGFYLGRVYFGDRFALNFTLLGAAGASAAESPDAQPADCR